MVDSGGKLTDARKQMLSVGIPLVGESLAFVRLLELLHRVAAHASATVLVRGETGTGKELIARAIHYLGDRREFPFIPVNCGAFPESLAENELFGHRSGAFTGAGQSAPGLARLADRGTLFLDEVDSLPAKAQVALLRFLQDGSFRPLGAGKEEHADVRIVAASNRCLENEILAGRFRQDLFYRLNLIAVDVPPLRTRAGDIQLLSKHFLQECAERYRLPGKRLHEKTLRWFDQYSWPGNVRELQNLIYREFLLSDAAELDIQAPGDLAKSQPSSAEGHAREAHHVNYRTAKSRVLNEFHRTYLTQVLQQVDGNVTKAAQLAGKERRAFGKLLKRYQITYDESVER